MFSFLMIGVKKGFKQHVTKGKTFRGVPESLLDPCDLECSLCMR